MATYMRSPTSRITRPEQGEHVERPEDDRVVAPQHRLEAEEPEAVEREDHLDEEGAGEQDPHECAREAGHHDEHRVAEDVPVAHPALARPPRPRRGHVQLVDLVQERVLGEHGEARERADEEGEDREGQVPEVVDDAVEPAERLPVLGGEAAERKPVEEAPSREQHDEQDREEEPGDRVADDDRGARPHVEGGAVAYRLGDPEGDRDEVHEEGGPQPEGDRHVHLVHDEEDHRPVAEVALPEVEAQVVPHHGEEALDGRAVEAVHPLDLAHELRVEPTRATVPGRDVRSRAPDRLPSAGARDPRRHVHAPAGVGLADLREELLHRAAGRDVDDDEVEDHDPEQGRDHEQEPADDVGGHRLRPVFSGGRPRSGAAARPHRLGRKSPAFHRIEWPSDIIGGQEMENSD